MVANHEQQFVNSPQNIPPINHTNCRENQLENSFSPVDKNHGENSYQHSSLNIVANSEEIQPQVNWLENKNCEELMISKF